jgi:tyrosine-protein phosphatase SIW14
VITQVDDVVWRGPRPEPSDLEAISDRVVSIISLERANEDEKEAIEFDPDVKVYSWPISPWEIYGSGITQEYLYKILGQISILKKPLLIHCQRGQDRTGLIIAAYRVKMHGWSKEVAMAEALQFGYRNWLNFGLNKTWRDF